MAETESVRVRLEQEQDFSFRVSFPGTQIDTLLADESEPVGEGRGPSPQHFLLAAIGNCLSASLLFALRKFRNDTERLVADVVAVSARNAEGRLCIPQVFVELQLSGTAADYEKLDRILDQFEAFCTVTQSIRQGIDVQVTVKDGEGRVLKGDKSFEAGS